MFSSARNDIQQFKCLRSVQPMQFYKPSDTHLAESEVPDEMGRYFFVSVVRRTDRLSSLNPAPRKILECV